jgi:hypothetical protein
VPSGDDVEAEITGLDQLGAALAWDAPSQAGAPASTGAGR